MCIFTSESTFPVSPEMAYSPLGEATVTADAFPMLSTGPRPTWLLKLRTCQPITLASCWTACTWCCDICNNTRWTQEAGGYKWHKKLQKKHGYNWYCIQYVQHIIQTIIQTASNKHNKPQPTMWEVNYEGRQLWYLGQEEVLQLLFLVGQCNDASISVHHSDLLDTDIQLQLNGPKHTEHIKPHLRGVVRVTMRQ